LEQKLTNLKAGLDERSKEIVDLIYYRRYFLQTTEEYYGYVFYDRQKIFTDWEHEEQKECWISIENYMETVTDEHIYPELYEDKTILVIHSGLAYLSQKVQIYIKGKDFIDGGAYYGDSALMFSKYLPSKIYAFEPMSEIFKGLQRLIETKPELKNICIPVQKGTGENSETTEFFFNGAGSGKNCSRRDYPAQIVDIIKLDDFITENNINLGLLKLDVEGSEFGTIKGALESIKKFRPVLLISIYHVPQDFFEIKPLLEKELNNYNFKIRKTNPFSPETEITLIGYPAELD
jgi:FkbM family methyltransferase